MLAIILLLVIALPATVITTPVATIVKDIFLYIISPGLVPLQNTLEHVTNVTVLDWPIAVFMILVLVKGDVSTVNVFMMDIFVKKCKPGFYRDPHTNECIPCSCDHNGSRNTQCDINGQCDCHHDVEGEKCDRCHPKFFNLARGGCQPCDCHIPGSLDTTPTCDSISGQCTCKANVVGQNVNNVKLDSWAQKIRMVKLFLTLTIHLVAFLAFVSVTQILAHLRHIWSRLKSSPGSIIILINLCLSAKT